MAAAKEGTKPKKSGGRFAEGHPYDTDSESDRFAEGHLYDTPSRVHFEEKLRDSIVIVTQEEDGSFLVKVGFLKIFHKYEITFTLPPLQRLGKDICAVPIVNMNLKVKNITAISEGYSVICEYTAQKEGVQKEEVLLTSETNDLARVKVVVQARVMERHHGTPMLLEGVKRIGAELDYDSEQSDWQGFD